MRLILERSSTAKKEKMLKALKLSHIKKDFRTTRPSTKARSTASDSIEQ